MTKLSSPKSNIAPLIGWCLFDFANSVPAVIGGIYFVKWFEEDLNGGSILLNVLFVTSAICVILSGRWIGRKIDKNGYGFWIQISSALVFVTILLLFWFSKIIPNQYLLLIAFLLFLVFISSYQISRICHNVYLHSVIPFNKHGRMSGLGAASNWAGSIVGILVTIPIMSLFPQMEARENTFLVAGVIFGVLTPIALYLMFLEKPDKIKYEIYDLPQADFKLSIIKKIGLMGLIYFLLFDVMGTVQRNLPTFLTDVYGLNDTIQAKGFIAILLSAMVGGIIASMCVTKENSKAWLKMCSFSLAMSILVIAIGTSKSMWLGFIIAGVSYGVLESAMRLNYMKTFGYDTAGENFGIFAIVERTSGLVGPFLWVVPFLMSSNKIASNTSAMCFMGGVALIAFFLLLKKRRDVNFH
jgi:MFS-type transporter involved in bile tolerance (Atg22 family)